jgi:ABC-type molybdate transport system substrate-binding protein
VFRKADQLKPGAYVTLDRKALQLTGGPSSQTPPPGRTIYGMLVAQGAADIFLTYCTNALAAQKEYPGQQLVALPDTLAVGADYGLTVMNDASPWAYKFAMFIISTEGQEAIARYGFVAPGLSQ